MMQFDDDDEEEFLKMMSIMLAKRRKSQERGNERRWGMCGTEETKYPDKKIPPIRTPQRCC